MTPRWLLPKTRVSHDENRVAVTQPGKTETAQTPRWDDFCFADEAAPALKDTQEEDRPKTSSGVSGRNRSKSTTRPQIGLTIDRPKTSGGRPLSTNYAPYSPSKMEEGMIGVAFGSPTHPPATIFGTLNDLAPPSTYEESVFDQPEPMYHIKGRTSKWKKLGSLFKGGKAVTDKEDMFEVPFYKVRVEDDTYEPEIETRGRKENQTVVELPARRSPTPPPKENLRRSIDERLAKARLEVARLEEAIADVEKKATEKEKEVSNDPSRPKLDLVIPDIKMDRYSVMFADLKEIPPHSKLLARRSKRLDPLRSISMEDMKQIDEAPTPDTSTLSPRLVLPRRATSPSATKTTAGFSLFPAAALTPNYMTRQTLATPSPQSHLKRSVTSPARLSPRAETFDPEKKQTIHPPRSGSANAVISPGDTTASSNQEAPWSAEAFLSPTSTITTIDEDFLLTPAKGKHSNEPEQAYPDANEARHMQFLMSPTLPRDIGETPEANTPVLSVDPSQEDDYKVLRVASSVFDAAIAEIAAFGVPSLHEQLPMPSPPSAYVPFVLAPEENEGNTTTITEKPALAISRSRFMMMNMPSPITEAPEESPVPSPARFKPVAPKAVAIKPTQEITALPVIPEPQRPAPPAPIKLVKPPVRKERSASVPRAAATILPLSIPEVSEESPRASPEKPRLQTQHMPPDKSKDLQASPPRQKMQVHRRPREVKQDSQREKKPDPPREMRQDHPRETEEEPRRETKPEQQTSPPRDAPRSNSRQRTSDKAARVLGEVLPAPEHQMATIITGRSQESNTNANAPSPNSPTDVPPAVPTKDSKFVLPLSRFAVKGTAAEVKSKSGLQASPRLATPPSKPVRAATEPLTTLHMNSSYPKSKPSRLVRSASDESLRAAVTNPLAKETATSHLEHMGTERSNAGVLTVMAIVKPVPGPGVVAPGGGEVGVARTVSLSRKPSQRILVKRPGDRDPSPEKTERSLLQKMQSQTQLQMPARASPVPLPVVAVRPPRSSSRPTRKGVLGNLKRSESFKRAIEVGFQDDEEGDMRSGELRARALSPEIGTVMTGLVVNGHKVMKSSVGIIEEA